MGTVEVKWKFYGYVTPAGGRDVQDWFDALPEEAKDEARDALNFLQSLPVHLWERPQFAPLGDDIFEIRFKVNVENEKRTYRIYGAYWPDDKRYSFTFLIGKYKKTANDRLGKKEAVKRLKRLKLQSKERATVHEFEFQEQPDRASSEGAGGAGAIH